MKKILLEYLIFRLARNNAVAPKCPNESNNWPSLYRTGSCSDKNETTLSKQRQVMEKIIQTHPKWHYTNPCR